MTLRNVGGGKLHPAVTDLCAQAEKGEIGRRQFLRTAAFLGVSVASAQTFLSGTPLGGVAPAPALAQEPKAGGSVRFACQIQEITDPALYNWIEASDLSRNSVEYLTYTDADNITHPYLAESWMPSDDLKVWTFKLVPGIKWSNGDAFGADDVIFNINRWMDPNSKSSNRSALEALEKVEKVSDTEIKLTLTRPVLQSPESFYRYTMGIVHRDFDKNGSNWPKSPIGTGPFEMTEYAVGKIARFKKRDGYWGKPAYLDEIVYIDMGTDIAAQVAALASNQVDILYRINMTELDLVERLPNAKVLKENSAKTICFRMQSDQKPFDDVRVRQAIVLAADNAKILELAYRGQGAVGENHHVAPVHPEYFPLPPLVRDVARSKALLAEAGFADGIDVELTLGNTQGKWEQDAAQVLQQQLAEAGIRVKLNVLPAEQYWPIWNKVPFGLTFWAHRPLGVMVLDLAYRSGAVWNESHFASVEFDEALNAASGIVDPKARSKVMEKVEKILQDSAVMVQPFFPYQLTAVQKNVMDFRAHPSEYYRMDAVWLA